MAWDECACGVQETLKSRDNRHCHGIMLAQFSYEMYSFQLSDGYAHALNNRLWCFSRRLDFTWWSLHLLRLF